MRPFRILLYTLCTIGLIACFDSNQVAQDENDRFSKQMLVQGEFTEPTEMTILPNNNVLIAQRRGELLHYNQATKALTQVGKLDVYYKTEVPDVNAEEGFMGLQKDPNYKENNWIYCFYSPTGSEWVNRLSRFKFKEGVFDRASEQIILDVESDRDICCHTGGSIAFGPDGLLYLSTGDNTTPFDKKDAAYVHHGFAPINDMPGDQQYDARRSSANTNDLRGKIIRIKVNDDGSYDIPAGNLFPVGLEKTRPEIYTMGHRNPYRISVDPKNGNLFWGDVGPDAQFDSLGTRGPRGYDEMNIATQAGNFGWPLFIADNKAYHDYDYHTGETGSLFDAAKPINDSKYNTGLIELPSAKSAFMYYPYDEATDFEGLTSGGRNAMAGPVYYNDMFQGTQVLPEYFDGKLIVYDWMRGWMKLVSFSETGELLDYQPFAPSVKLNSLIDMELSDDGRIYLLEYGNGWFKQNKDSGLSILNYNPGNRPPVIDAFEIDKNSGRAPLTIEARIAATDLEKDPISYHWYFGDSLIRISDTSINFTFEQNGVYEVYAEAIDARGDTSKTDMKQIVVGNTRPTVEIDVNNQMTYRVGEALSYQIKITDPEDGADLNMDNIYVSVDYMESLDEIGLSLGHQQASVVSKGKLLVETLDCKACHKAKEKSIGPNYTEIAQRHKSLEEPIVYLKSKISSGGNGVWGAVPMAAHPNLTDAELTSMAAYILSLDDALYRKASLPLSGTVKPSETGNHQLMVLRASYTDKGTADSPELIGIETIRLNKAQ